jgi:hypothetical protein
MTVKFAQPLWAGWATEVAVTVKLKLAETFAGALYVADVLVTLVNVPHAEPAHPGPVTDHVTALLKVLEALSAKLAVNCKV